MCPWKLLNIRWLLGPYRPIQYIPAMYQLEYRICVVGCISRDLLSKLLKLENVRRLL
jgi:hypothetical protein